LLVSQTVKMAVPSETDALQVKKYLAEMFETTKKGEDRKLSKYKTRAAWMKFLNSAYYKFFNPCFPNHSGDLKVLPVNISLFF
jgi:hypothetical protein